MKSITIKATARKELGSKEAKNLRRDNQVPCVIYGGETPIHFSAPELSFRNLVYTPDAFIVEVDVEGTVVRAVMKDIQFHPLTERIVHIDFMQVFDDKPVIMDIPVRLEGNAIGVRNGGNLRFNRRKLSVKALPDNLPDIIEVDIEKMRIGDIIKVADLSSESYEFMVNDNAVVVAIKMARNAVLDEADEDEEGEAAAEATEAAAE